MTDYIYVVYEINALKMVEPLVSYPLEVFAQRKVAKLQKRYAHTYCKYDYWKVPIEA